MNANDGDTAYAIAYELLPGVPVLIEERPAR